MVAQYSENTETSLTELYTVGEICLCGARGLFEKFFSGFLPDFCRIPNFKDVPVIQFPLKPQGSKKNMLP